MAKKRTTKVAIAASGKGDDSCPMSPSGGQNDKCQKGTPTSSSKKGGKQSIFKDAENIEILNAFSEGKLKLKADKKWAGKSTLERFKLMHASAFATGELESGRTFSAEDFQNAVNRLKRRYSLKVDKKGKSGSGAGSRTRLSDELFHAMESIWAKDPAINVDKKQIGSASGGMSSDEEVLDEGGLHKEKKKVREFYS